MFFQRIPLFAWVVALIGLIATNFETIWLPMVATAAGESAPAPAPSGVDWSQDGGNAQRTGYSADDPAMPWDFVWSWNGPDANASDTCPNGPQSGHCYDAPREARTIVGDKKLFAPAGIGGLYAIDLASGKQLWRVGGIYNAAPAYANGFVYAGRADGTVVKLAANSGAISAQYNAGGAVDVAMLADGAFVYAVSQNGRLHKINTSNMSAAWVYDAGAGAAISMALSARAKLVIYATDDLYIHAVNVSDGSRKWRVKPSVHDPGFDYKFSWGWPVVADNAGIVLLRMRLDRNAVYGGREAETLADLRKTFDCSQNPSTCNPAVENLFALNINSGERAFYPLVAYGSVEFWDAAADNFSTDQGGLPVVKTLSNGKQVAYVQWRNGTRANTVSPGSNDSRMDSELGEMVLDDNTVSGYRAGDIRWVSAGNMKPNSETYERMNVAISDEQSPLSMAGNTLFYSHWAAMESVSITDRGNGRGNTYNNPIRTTVNAPVVRDASCPSSADNKQEHYCATSSIVNAKIPNSYLGRSWVTDNGGWYTYLNILSKPGSPFKTSYSAGPLPRYTYVSSGYVVVEGNGGDLMVFRHGGR